jgi:signal transduction histidine kinase
MRKITLIVLLSGLSVIAAAQAARTDSLKLLLQTEKEDTTKALIYSQLARAYLYVKPDTALLYAQEGLVLGRKTSYKRAEGRNLVIMANVFALAGNYARALELSLQALKLAEEAKDEIFVSSVQSSLADFYFYSGDMPRSIDYSYKSIASNRKTGRISSMYNDMINLGDTYENIGRLDSALLLTMPAYQYAKENNDLSHLVTSLINLGNIYTKLNKADSAMAFYRASLPYLVEDVNDVALSEANLGIAKLFLQVGKKDSALYFGQTAFAVARDGDFKEAMLDASNFLAGYFKSVRNIDSAYAYQSATIAIKDSLFNQQKANEIQSLSYEETLRQQQQVEEREKAKVQLRQNAMIGGLATLLIIAFLLLRNNRQRRKANEQLQQQKEQLASQKEVLEQSYSNVELLGEIGRKITASLSAETIIGTAYNNVNSLMDASVFGIGIYHEETNAIHFPSTYENGKALPAYSHPVEDENRLGSICFRTNQEIVISDLTTEYSKYLKDLPDPTQGKQSVSLIYLPLKVKENILGVITVQSFEKNAYTDYQLYMLRNISVYAAMALEHAEAFDKLNSTVNDLQRTQKQLIQAEKMASLGELTAGIAHEIQNPLNFVNNFSEINKELLEELHEEIEAGNFSEVKSIAVNIGQNHDKINHHGRRADSIVKGMLEHSRSGTGQSGPTNINALADEYLRLAYHGIRARDKSFNTGMKTNFDDNIGTINVIPQDIGRVLLNLYNNSFYAVNEKINQRIAGYEPMVSVTTEKAGGYVHITVTDNGSGIPKTILDKIFQPFYTTKPTGQGTGLGLSLTYDIVKSHGGEIHVDTMPGEGTSFVIKLPVD